MIPQEGVYRTERHDYYWNGAGPFPGVTGALNIIDKPALAGWAKIETAKAALRNLDLLFPMAAASGEEAVVKWLATIPGYVRDAAGSLGTRVHALAELASTGAVPDASEEERPYLDAYLAFLKRYAPRFVGVELQVISLTHGYGGTLDILAYIGPYLYLIDIKTSKGTYKETALQLAAYGAADFVGYAGDPQPYELPKPDRYAVLHLRPDAYPDTGYRLLEYVVGPAEELAFYAALGLSTWAKSARPIGEPVPTSWVQRR